MTIYPSAAEVITANARLVARFGGLFGVRDRAALESAVARPQMGYYSDVIQEAAALLSRKYLQAQFRRYVGL